jgi:predicted Zn-dependent peptidase
MATRLHYRLCDQRGLAYSVHASIEPLADAAVLDVSGATSHGKVSKLVGGVLELLAEFRNSPVDAAELARVKRRYETDLIASVDDSAAMAGWFGGTALYYSPPNLDTRRKQMGSVGPDDIVRVARRVVRPSRLAVAVVGALSPAQQGDVRDAVTSWS